MDVGTEAVQRAQQGAHRRDDLAVLVGRKPANEVRQLGSDGSEVVTARAHVLGFKLQLIVGTRGPCGRSRSPRPQKGGISSSKSSLRSRFTGAGSLAGSTRCGPPLLPPSRGEIASMMMVSLFSPVFLSM